MNLDECRTQAERDVLITYRRHMRRKSATPFTAQGSALREELQYGAVLSPNFVDRFTSGTRTLDETGRNLRLTGTGRAYVEHEAGIGTEPEEWHHWTTVGDYVRSGCGLIRNGLRQSQTEPPTNGRLCGVCEIAVSTVERTVNS